MTSCAAKPGTGYTPIKLCENITLPIASAEILDAAQIGKTLYLLGSGGVYSLDLETGDSSRIFDTDCRYLEAYGGLLHLFLPEEGCFRAYTEDGELQNELILDDYKNPEPNSFKGFAAGDGRYIFAADNGSGGLSCVVCDMKTGEVKTFGAPKNLRRLCSYKDGKFLAICYSTSAADCAVWEINADTEKSTKLGDINDMYLLFDAAYNPHTDSLLMSACGADMQVFISEFTINSLENSIISKPKLQAAGQSNFRLAVSENIASYVTDLAADYYFYDYENPTPSITFAYFGVQRDLTDFISEFESKNDVIVKVIHYDKEQVENLNIKLMAGDSDIDCFSTNTLRKFAYITNYQFEDLYQFNDLADKIRANPFAEAISTFDYRCFGIPYALKFYPEGSTPYDGLDEESVNYLEEMRLDGKYFYLRSEQLKKYIRLNIDLETGRYSDPEGEEFYEVLKQAHENSGETDSYTDYSEIPYIRAEQPYVEAEYLMMNPTSEKKELTASFLAQFFDYIDGGEAEAAEDYLESSGSAPALQIQWKYDDYTTCEPLYEAFNSIFATGENNGGGNTVTDESLRALAHEAASEVAMRIGE